MKPVAARRRPVVARLNPVSGAVALAVGSLSIAGVATAAEEDDAFRGFFEDIVVTATRRTTDVQDVPYNIAAFSGETLQQQRITSLGEFARWVPGLTVTDQGPRNASLLTVRGLNASTITAAELFLSNSGGDTVSTYLGEIPLYVDLKPYDIDRVEVLIGPQGTLYGAGTLAGAVRYIPNRPAFDGITLDTHVKGYHLDESDDLGWGADATLNLPLVADTLAFRGTIGYVEEAGFVDYPYLVRVPGVSDPEPDLGDPAAVAANLREEEDVNQEETLSARAALLWDVTADLQAMLTYYFQNQDVGGRSITHMASFGTGEYEAAHRFVEPNERENQLLALEVNADFELPVLGPVELTSATGFSEFEESGQRDQTDLLLDFGFGYEDFPAFAAFTRDVSEEETFTQELRLVSTGSGPWNWIAGFFYYDSELDAVSEEFTPGIPEFFGIAPPPLPTGDLEYLQLTREEKKEVAVFGELGYQITEAWQVTGGLRWFDFEDEVMIAVDLPLIGVVNSPFESAKTEDDDITWKLSTSYVLDDMLPPGATATGYLTISKGYRLGGVNVFEECDVPLPPGQNVCLLPDEVFFEPDKTTNYEIGLKSNWLDDSLLFNVALFYVDWEDVQTETISINGSVPITDNASEAVSQGVELQSRWQINDSWAVFTSYAYTNAELSEDATGAIGTRFGNVDAFDGDRLPGTPEHQAALNLNFNTQVFGGLLFEANYGLTAISDVYTKIGLRGDGEALGGFTLHNASLSLSGDRWTATLYAENLTDKFARTGVRADRGFIDTVGPNDFTLRRYFSNVIRPRSIGVDIRYNFDF